MSSLVTLFNGYVTSVTFEFEFEAHLESLGSVWPWKNPESGIPGDEVTVFPKLKLYNTNRIFSPRTCDFVLL